MRINIHRVVKPLMPLFMLMLVGSTYAADKPSIDCSSAKVKTKGMMYLLNTEAQKTHGKIFLIKNISRNEVWMTHPQGPDATAAAGWASTIKAGNWSALLLSKQNFSLSCTSMSSNTVTDLDCGKVLKVCEANVSDTSKESANYWLSEDQSWDNLVKAVIARLK